MISSHYWLAIYKAVANITMPNVVSVKKQKMTQKMAIFRIFCELSRNMPLEPRYSCGLRKGRVEMT